MFIDFREREREWGGERERNTDMREKCRGALPAGHPPTPQPATNENKFTKI